MRYDVQIPQRSMDAEKLEAEIVSDDKNQYAILSVDGQKVSLPFQVIDILHHEAEVVRYSEYVREMWAEDYEGELSDEKVREISEYMLDYLTLYGDACEIEELNAQLKEANDERNAALREETSRRLKETNALHITGATLLSVKEAKNLDEDMLKASSNWWLRSPGGYDILAAFVNGEYGLVHDYGRNVEESFGVRPALKISNLESSIYQIGDTLSFGDHSFTIISKKYALCNEIVEKRPFCDGYNKTNDYKASDIKVFVDNWFDRTKELEAERVREDNLNKARQVWDELTDVPMDPETECIESDWKQFPAGTHREEIWHWIEDIYHVSVAEDLMYACEEPEKKTEKTEIGSITCSSEYLAGGDIAQRGYTSTYYRIGDKYYEDYFSFDDYGEGDEEPVRYEVEREEIVKAFAEAYVHENTYTDIYAGNLDALADESVSYEIRDEQIQKEVERYAEDIKITKHTKEEHDSLKDIWLNGAESGEYSNSHVSVQMFIKNFTDADKEHFEDLILQDQDERRLFGGFEGAFYADITDHGNYKELSFDLHKGDFEAAKRLSKIYPEAVVFVNDDWDEHNYEIYRNGKEYNDYTAEWDGDEPEPYPEDGEEDQYDIDVKVGIRLPFADAVQTCYSGGGDCYEEEFLWYKNQIDIHPKEQSNEEREL